MYITPKYKPEQYTVVSNALVQSTQDMTLREHKLLRLLIAQIDIDDTDLKTYMCKTTDLADFFGVSLQAIHKDLPVMCVDLRSRTYLIKSDNGRWRTFSWLDKASYADGLLTLKLSDDLSEHLLMLQGRYLQYQLKEIVNLHSVYGLRLYEILVAEYNNRKSLGMIHEEITLGIDELKHMLACEEKFKKISQFKEKVIDKAIADINSNSDSLYKIKHTYIKDRKVITSVLFCLTKR